MAFCAMRCPHCNTEKVSFVSVAEAQISSTISNVFFICGHCKEAVIARIQKDIPNRNPPHNHPGLLDGMREYSILSVVPEPMSISAPKFTPININKYFVQAVDSLRHDHFDAAGMMFRKVIDVTTKELGATKGKLQPRIDELAAKHAITPAMQEWAHAIRLDGNEAAHEEEPFDKETCEALKSFTELFLMYAFTLPGMLEERRAKKSS